MTSQALPARLGAGAILGLMLAVSGCQSGGVAKGDNAVAGVDATAPPPPEEKITQSELRAYCPSVIIRQGTSSYNAYAKGGDGDASKLIHQTSISDATRSCTRADGTMTIKVAVAGRVVPGPLAQAGPVTMPIRVAVLQGQEVLYSQLHRYQVTLAGTREAQQFVFSDPNVSIPIPPDGQGRIFVGFDEGPEKQAD